MQVARVSPELLERESEVTRMGALATDAARGDGSVVVIEGDAGIGKTALLAAAAARAPAAGIANVLRARGGMHERDLAFGVVRELFAPLLVETERRERLLTGAAALAEPLFSPTHAVNASADEFAAFHGLYWLLGNATEAEPSEGQGLLLAVDDAQWADPSSVRWLLYLAHRIEDLPVLLALTVRLGEPLPEPLEELRGLPQTQTIRPGALSGEAVDSYVRIRLSTGADPAFCAACGEVTGGNPFLLSELVRALAQESVEPTGDRAERVAEIGAVAVADRIMQRIRMLAPDALAVARAVAILGPHAGLRLVGELAQLDAFEVAAAADALVSAGILRDSSPLEFVHPLVLAAVEQDLSDPERRRLHAGAADVHRRRGEAADVVATHLLRTDIAAGEWVANKLGQAADEALARAAPAMAVRYLRRALEEPLAEAERFELERRLGESELHAGDEAGIARLVSIRDRIDDPIERLKITARLSTSYEARGRWQESRSAILKSIAELEGHDPRSAVFARAGLLVNLMISGGEEISEVAAELHRDLDQVDPKSVEGRLATQAVAWWAAFGTGPRGEARALAERALGTPEEHAAMARQGWPLVWCVNILAATGATDHALEAAELAVAVMRARGIRFGTAACLAVRASVRLARGELFDAESDAADVLALTEDYPVMRTCAIAVLLAALRAKGRADEGERLLVRENLAGDAPRHAMFMTFPIERALLRIAQGRFADALEDLPADEEDGASRCDVSASLALGHLSLPLALHGAGRAEAARLQAAAAAASARERGDPRECAETLRVLGLVDPSAGVEALREAAELLAPTGFSLDRAQALLDLGAALRRSKERRASREPLRAALDLAHRLGARAIAERAREELAATGARPRSAVLSGAESLTPSERRVARMAAEGMSNPEIAQALFVSRNTVETQLRACYRKLEISGRGELAAALVA